MKCGSSSLHNYLNLHPDIFMSRLKETNYFIKELNYHKGLDWYRSNFITDKKLCGESSVGYSKRDEFEGVPERIHRLLPEVKLIYIVRDPIERCKSHFLDDMLYLQNKDSKYPSISEELGKLKQSHIVSASLYHYQIEAYLKYFNAGQIMVVQTERMQKQPVEVMNEVFNYLGVPPVNVNDFDHVVNPTSGKVVKSNFRKALDTLKPVSTLRKMIPQKVRTKVSTNTLYKKMFYSELKSFDDTIDPELEGRLKVIFREDTEKLKNFTKLSFEEWNL